MTPAGWPLLAAILSVATALAACDADVQDIRIAAQDFRFDPSTVRLEAARPIRLVIVNEGRESHEFTSPLLADPRVHHADAESADVSRRGGVSIPPGRSVMLTFQAPPGTYLYRCAIRGHAGMTGTMIVD